MVYHGVFFVSLPQYINFLTSLWNKHEIMVDDRVS